MDEVKETIRKIIQDKALIEAVLSNARKKDPEGFTKTVIRPVLVKDVLVYQFTYHYTKKVIHENLTPEETIEKIYALLEDTLRQGQLYCADSDYQILISKKGKAALLKKPPTKKAGALTHNRKKQYIIPENTPCSFLIRLGVMNDQGKVLANKYDKFRQINRFLEMVADVAPYFKDKDKRIDIVDFGCGKSYLTFALYYYLKDVLHMDVHIIGLDLKKDVVEHCNIIAQDLKYDALTFITGDIKDYTGREKIDMMVSLHACDTATDAALVKAIGWDADIILSVPCCQHELLKQVHNDVMESMTKHGIIKERMSALITDSIRANILEIMGYTTQILEFIDMEHTPKNLLIRAVKSNRTLPTAVMEYKKFKEFWHVEPYLEKALGDKLLDRMKRG
ncbi:MAG: class I SAM-dependent methyltransferase [Bacillota bacterium]